MRMYEQCLRPFIITLKDINISIKFEPIYFTAFYLQKMEFESCSFLSDVVFPTISNESLECIYCVVLSSVNVAVQNKQVCVI